MAFLTLFYKGYELSGGVYFLKRVYYTITSLRVESYVAGLGLHWRQSD